MEQATPTQFLCTRPSLAAELQKYGHEATPAVNPWHPERTSWLFDIDRDVIEIVTAFYAERGQQPPAAIRKAAKQL